MKISRYFSYLKKEVSRSFSTGFILLIAVIFPAISFYFWGRSLVRQDPRKVVAVKGAITERQPAPFKEPLISVTFDDGWESIYQNAYPLLARYDIPTTQYLIASLFDDVNYMSIDQAKDMQAHGHEIASHTLTHADLVDSDDYQLSRELSESRAILSKNFGQIREFATPEGHYDDRVLSAIARYYRSHRNTDADPRTISDVDYNTEANFKPYNIIAYAVRATTTSADIDNLIKAVKAKNAWLVLVYHQVETQDNYYTVSPSVFESQLIQIKHSGLKTVTVGQFLDKWELDNVKE